jgi:hypothetical protein
VFRRATAACFAFFAVLNSKDFDQSYDQTRSPVRNLRACPENGRLGRARFFPRRRARIAPAYGAFRPYGGFSKLASRFKPGQSGNPW